MNNQLAVLPKNLPAQRANRFEIRNYDDLSQIGRVLAQSGFFKDTKGEAQAIAKILAGMELGIPPVAALRGVYIVEGQTTLAYPLIASLIKQSGKYDYRVRVQTAQECAIEFFQGDESLGVVRTTMKDMDERKVSQAYKDGAWKKKFNWIAFPENMLFARTISNGAKWYCPDVFNGPIYTPDELGHEVDGETGDVVVEPVAPRPPRPAPQWVVDLQGFAEEQGLTWPDALTIIELIFGKDWTRQDAPAMKQAIIDALAANVAEEEPGV